MRTTICCILLYVLVSGHTCTKLKTGSTGKSADSSEVTVSVRAVFHYCGGAKPPDDVQAEVGKLKSVPNQLFHIKAGFENKTGLTILKSIITDSVGVLRFKLPEGDYMLAFPEQAEEMDTTKYTDNKYHTFDRKCLMEWWKTPALKFSVVKGKVHTYVLQIDRKCFVSGWWTCETYIGPPPPVRPRK